MIKVASQELIIQRNTLCGGNEAVEKNHNEAQLRLKEDASILYLLHWLGNNNNNNMWVSVSIGFLSRFVIAYDYTLGDHSFL